jgi:hypothetical protein
MTAPATGDLPNWAALAGELGVSTRAVTEWRKRYPDAPERPNLADWLAFKRRKALGASNSKVGKDRETILAEKALAETKLIHLKIAKEERKLIPAEMVEEFHLFAASRIKSSLYQLFATELPPKTANLEVTDVRKANRDACDVLCVSMAGLFDQWREEQEAARAAAATVESEKSEDDE